MTPAAHHRQGRMAPQLVIGIFIVAAGVLMMLDNLGLTDARGYLRYWPVALVAVGAAKLWESRRTHCGAFAGTVFVLAGSWLLLESARIVRVSFWDAWPILLVLLGASIVWRGIRGPATTGTDTNDSITAFAMLGGVNRGNNSRAFKGGELTAIMGGCEIDLRQAAIDGEATIEVFAMWGGIEIRVPENWTVIGRVNPVLGGFDDRTRPPQGASAHRLIIGGFVIMGGVEVKN